MKKIVQVTAIDSTMRTGLRELNVQSIKQGYEVIGICSPGPNTVHIESEGIKLVHVNIDRKIGISNLRSVYKLKKEFDRLKPDIVHVHTPVAAVLARIAAKMAKVPNIIYTAHGFYFHENMSRIKYSVFYMIEKVMAKLFTDYIFTQSEEDAELAIKKNFLPQEKILCIGNGVDVETKFNPTVVNSLDVDDIYKEFNIKKDDLVISFIGRLVKEKGIFELLEAFETIDNKNIKLLVIGDAAQNERDNVTVNKLNDYKNNENIIFTGRRDDVNKLLAVSDIFCLPSYREGMPRSIIEAMAMQNAVIATNIRGSREEVVHGKTGFLIPLYDSTSIKENILKLFNDRQLLEKMKKAGRERALKLYNEKTVVAKQINVFDQLLEKKGN